MQLRLKASYHYLKCLDVTDLRSFTQGRGTYVMQTDHYEEVPKSIAKEIIEKNSTTEK